MEEIWKEIPGFKGRYSVSDMGSVKGREIKKISPNKKGYGIVCLCGNGKSATFQVHRLVAECFIPNPENKRTVNHKDGNKLNNAISNLEWATNLENIRHAIRTGLSNPCNNRPLRKVAQIKDGKVAKIFKSTNELTKAGFDRRVIYQCVAGKERRRTHKGYSWKFID